MLGKPKNTDRSRICTTLLYRIKSEEGIDINLKIEINTREHFNVLGFHEYSLTSTSSWFSGNATILSYKPEELMGTKLRAFYQRKKGRDLFDLHKVLSLLPDLHHDKIILCFKEYMKQEGKSISKQDFLANIEEKLNDKGFREDIIPLLAQGTIFDPDVACQLVCDLLIEKL